MINHKEECPRCGMREYQELSLYGICNNCFYFEESFETSFTEPVDRKMKRLFNL
ncbi:MAG: hypothetical protein N4A33_02930 [Bacteriovoracaceae bacterium]|jgi:hypothetical protein|nr:hypothetical protein [Bacteriovoracaceae bacterium]